MYINRCGYHVINIMQFMLTCSHLAIYLVVICLPCCVLNSVTFIKMWLTCNAVFTFPRHIPTHTYMHLSAHPRLIYEEDTHDRILTLSGPSTYVCRIILCYNEPAHDRHSTPTGPLQSLKYLTHV